MGHHKTHRSAYFKMTVFMKPVFYMRIFTDKLIISTCSVHLKDTITHHHMKNPGNRFGWLMRVEEVVVGLQIQVSQEEVEALVLPGAYQILLWKEAVEWLAVPLKCCHFYLLEEEEVGEALNI